MPNFLINMYNICQTPETCGRNRKSTQTLISEGQYVMKWVEPALENQKSKRGCLADSYLRFYFFGDAWLRSRATIYQWYNGRDMYLDAHLVAPPPHKSHYDVTPVSGGKSIMSPELVRLHFREPWWWSRGWKIHLKKLSRFRGYLVEWFLGVSFL